MFRKDSKRRLLLVLFGLLLGAAVQAGLPPLPILTIDSVASYPPHITITSADTAIIQYRLTNQSARPHRFQTTPLPAGMSATGCEQTLITRWSSCILTLTVNGSLLSSDIIGGPVICDQDNPVQCYQPCIGDRLAIRLAQQNIPQQFVAVPVAGAGGSIIPNSPQLVNEGGSLTFTAIPNPGSSVAQWFVDTIPVQAGGATFQLTNIRANHTVEVTFSNLVAVTPNLALSISCLPASACMTTQNAALTGNPRQVIFQNASTGTVNNITISASGFPTGTTISNDGCTGAVLNAGASCAVTITPGMEASSTCTTGTVPTPGTVVASVNGGVSASSNIYVLGYGCQHQGGFIFSVDDDYANFPITGSIGGKVASLVDQAQPIDFLPPFTSVPWDADPACVLNCSNATGAWDGSIGLNLASVPGSTNPANTGTNGPGNTYLISSILNGNPVNNTNGPPATYAAGVCISYTGGGFSNWYLPAICEMDSFNGSGANCPAAVQSMINNLFFLIGNSGAAQPSTSCSPPSGTTCLAGDYWSSTENSTNPLQTAWAELFTLPASLIHLQPKSNHFGIRCARAFTN